MSGKRKAVPRALRSELSEYSSLIRALQTTATLDVSAQLRQRVDTYREGWCDTQDASTSSKSTSQTTKDSWTRWPLLLQNVPNPEWTFEEETQSLVADAEKRRRKDKQQSHHVSVNDLDSYTKTTRSPFVGPVARHLVQILAAISAHIPLQEKSLQNRLRLIGWREVLEIAGVAGLVDDQTIERIKERMLSAESDTR